MSSHVRAACKIRMRALMPGWAAAGRVPCPSPTYMQGLLLCTHARPAPVHARAGMLLHRRADLLDSRIILCRSSSHRDLAPQLGGELDAELILDDSKENVWVRPG